MSSYYRGDYYRGDYYRGDPGFFSSLGNIAKKVAGVVSRVVPGPVGALAGAVSRFGGGGGQGGVGPPGPALPIGIGLPSPFGPVMNFGNNPLAAAAGGYYGGQVSGNAAASNAPGTAMAPYRPGPLGAPWGRTVMGELSPAAVAIYKGTHVNRSSYFRRMPDGGVAFIEKGSVAVRNRRMNACNGRALRRALRRAQAFKKVAMRSINLVSPPGKKKRFGGFKMGRKRRA